MSILYCWVVERSCCLVLTRQCEQRVVPLSLTGPEFSFPVPMEQNVKFHAYHSTTIATHHPDRIIDSCNSPRGSTSPQLSVVAAREGGAGTVMRHQQAPGGSYVICGAIQASRRVGRELVKVIALHCSCPKWLNCHLPQTTPRHICTSAEAASCEHARKEGRGSEAHEVLRGATEFVSVMNFCSFPRECREI